eukprot:3388138-Pyramimonas_sp.AAC.2
MNGLCHVKQGEVIVRDPLWRRSQVHIYGFSVDAGYTKWTRYFSKATSGHYPLTGRSYYQVLLPHIDRARYGSLPLGITA